MSEWKTLAEFANYEFGLRRAGKATPAPPDFSPGPTIAQKYEQLLLAVESKYPGESRHETALRYIRERESRSDGEAMTPSPSLEAARIAVEAMDAAEARCSLPLGVAEHDAACFAYAEAKRRAEQAALQSTKGANRE